MSILQFNSSVRSIAFIGILILLVSAGCHTTSMRTQSATPLEHEIYRLAELPGEKAIALLSPLNLGNMRLLPDGKGLSVASSPERLARVRTIIELVDHEEEYMAGLLVPASEVRAIPSNKQIADALGGIAIGTFANPPPRDGYGRSIIDVHGDDVIVIMPVRFRKDLLIVAHLGIDGFRQQVSDIPLHDEADPSPHDEVQSVPSMPISDEQGKPESPLPTLETEARPVALEQPNAARLVPQRQSAEMSDPHEAHAESSADSDAASTEQPPSDSVDMTLQLASSANTVDAEIDEPVPVATHAPAEASVLHPTYGPPPLPNADDVLELDLPPRIQLTHLLDLIAEYLHLDYVYEPSQVRDEEVTLKLHGKLQGRIQVKDLYPLLESILKFKGLAMTRHEDNLVTIVPIHDALDADPPIVDPNNRDLAPGNMVITRIFHVQHIDALGAASLLENMRLGVASFPISDTGTLIVTCYAHRMARIEQLLDLVDRPGKTRRFRFQQLKYTMVSRMIRKVDELARELQSVPVSIVAPRTTSAPSPRVPVPSPPLPGQRAGLPADADATATPPVYLDADERRNRVLMIGYDEQLAIVEELIAVLDVEQQGIRITHIYSIHCVDASEVKSTLQELHLTSGAPSSGPVQPPGGSPSQLRSQPTHTTGDLLVDEPQIVVLEATNALLITATAEQHALIAPIIRQIDAMPEDSRILRSYIIRHIDAEEVMGHLLKFGFTHGTVSAEKIQRVASGPMPTVSQGGVQRAARLSTQQPQITVIKATNSILMNANSEQHERVRAIMDHIDVEMGQKALPYEIYFLENQDPDQLAEVLGKLVRETIANAEGKTETILSRTEEPVTIIPDKNTFSLIVHTSRKNHVWIGDLIGKLDKRRPQVLIDVTLVEITEADAFDYDLNLIASASNLTHTSGLTGALVPGFTSADVVDRLADTGRDRFTDFQSNRGELTAFYGDGHINALLSAMQSRDYGRVLAKPKILVNDNDLGMIKTADTTYVAKRASIPVGTGGGGTDIKLIETSVTYDPYEAGIILNITPHISQGNLLRLEIELERSDFRETADTDKPPDQIASELKTTVFVPDGSTIILGGLLRLNQSKGGRKVPILGDIPIIGGLFRTINNRDVQSKLYIFVKAEIIRPAGHLGQGMEELEAVSERNREAFERHEEDFQKHPSWPGIKPRPTAPPKVLEAQ